MSDFSRLVLLDVVADEKMWSRNGTRVLCQYVLCTLHFYHESAYHGTSRSYSTAKSYA